MHDWDNGLNVSDYITPGMEYLEIENEGRVRTLNFGTVTSLEEAYIKYSPLAAVIIRLCGMFVNGKTEVLNRTTQNYVRGQYKAWDRLFEQPNWMQTKSEFETQLMAFVLLRGWCYVMPVYGSSFTDVPVELWILPPWCVFVEPVQVTPHKLRSGAPLRKVWFRYGNYSEQLDESKLILYKDPSSPIIDHTTLLPISRCYNLKYPISNGVKGYESRNTLIVDRGARGILANQASDSVGAIPIDPVEHDRLNNMYKGYGLTKANSTKGNIIVTSAALKWQPMTFNVKELMLHEEHVSAIKDICDMYNYQYRLLSTGEGATYANAKEDKVSVYHDAVIPFAQSYCERTELGVKARDQNITILKNYDGVPVLQQSEKEKGAGKLSMNMAMLKEWDAGQITRNDWRIAVGRDTVPREEFNKFKWELTPEQLGIIIDDTKTDPKDEKTGK